MVERPDSAQKNAKERTLLNRGSRCINLGRNFKRGRIRTSRRRLAARKQM